MCLWHQCLFPAKNFRYLTFFLYSSPNKGNDNCCDPIYPSLNCVTWVCFPSMNAMEIHDLFPILGIEGALQFSVFLMLGSSWMSGSNILGLISFMFNEWNLIPVLVIHWICKCVFVTFLQLKTWTCFLGWNFMSGLFNLIHYQLWKWIKGLFFFSLLFVLNVSWEQKCLSLPNDNYSDNNCGGIWIWYETRGWLHTWELPAHEK